ncbi:MAG: hypothetical protein NTX79_00195 [Candidatus Micrarchaeota archaeon]|nr:hypothetical protein [Candidatus Micrarchaeota archaeon]
MHQPEKPGVDRTKYFIVVGMLAAVALLGISMYLANSAKATAGAGALPAKTPALNGSGSAEPHALNPAPQLLPNSSVATGSGGEAQVPQVKAPAKEVTLDFLYEDGCPYCQAMKPIVSALAAALPADRFEVRYWNVALRGSNATVEAVYADYGAKGYYRGSVPTFVANWDDYRVGTMGESDFKAWVCSKFSAPKPSAC